MKSISKSNCRKSNSYVDSFNKNKIIFYELYKSMFAIEYMKILMDILEIDYVEMEDTFAAWKAKAMIKFKMPNSIAPFQMFNFFSRYGLTNSSARTDLDCEQAQQMLKTICGDELKIEGKEHLKTKVKDQNSSDGASNFVASYSADVATIQLPSSKMPYLTIFELSRI